MKYICDSCEKYPCSADETKLMLSCPAYSPKSKPITNADRIRSMSDEELAAYLEEVELAAVRAYGNDDLLLNGELRAWWLLRLKKEFDANAKSI